MIARKRHVRHMDHGNLTIRSFSASLPAIIELILFQNTLFNSMSPIGRILAVDNEKVKAVDRGGVGVLQES